MKPVAEASPATLVELEGCPGLALVFGEQAISGLDVIPPALFPTSAASSATDAISALTGSANIATQAGQATAGLQGLVRLTPETLTALQTATPMTNAAGANLGALVDSSGRIAHSVQWVPAGAAGAVGVAAALGPAVALLLIQLQLAKISSLVRENIALTDDLLQTVKREQWAGVDGLHAAMLKAIDEAQHVGHVTGHIWENVAGHEAELRASRTLFRDSVNNHRTRLAAKKDHRARVEYLKHHAEEVITDAQAMIRAQAAWFTYQAIRAGRVHADPNEPDSLVGKIVLDARTEHDRELGAVDQLLHQLHWQLSVLADLPGKQTVPFTKSRRAAKDVARVSRVLKGQVSAMRESISIEVPPLPEPVVVAFPHSLPEHLPWVIRWHLKEEQLLAVAEGRTKWKGRSWTHYLAATDKRLLILAKEDFERHGEISRSIDLDSIRYVRYQPAEEGEKGRLDIITPERDHHYEFETWADHGGGAEAAQRFADMLGSHMNLPASEIPDSPIVGALAVGLTSLEP
jgi:hypothetical protein